MTSHHNTQNTTITQQMSVLGGGAGCWYPSPSATQLPPTAPLRHKRQSTPSHQPLSVHHVMHLGAPSPHTPHTPLQTQTHHQPLSPKAPNGPHMGPHLNHHNPHSVHMSTSAQGALLASHPQELSNGGMTTSLHCMPALHQQQQHILQQQQQQLHNITSASVITSASSSTSTQLSAASNISNNTNSTTNTNSSTSNNSSNSTTPNNTLGGGGVVTGVPPDISSIQQGIPQPLRGNKPTTAADLRNNNNMPWHHGKITRDRAEQLLHPRSDGLFLVRESTNFPGDQTLCVCFQGRVEHYRIKCTPQATLTIDDEEFFPTLPELIDHYLQDADGLCTQLVKCLPKRQQPLMTTSSQQQPNNSQIPSTTQQQTQQQQQTPQNQQQQQAQQMLQQQKSALHQQQQMLQAQQMLPQQGQMMQGQVLHQQGQMLHQPQQGQMLHQQGPLMGQQQMLQGQMQMSQPPPQNQQQAGSEHNLPPCLAPQAFVDAGWMIAERDLEIRENIGKGEFGDVMLGILNGQRVAVKMLKDSEAASKFLAEASLMTSLKHENLVKLLGLVFNKQHICLVTEYMSKGSLVDYLRSRGRLHVTKRDQIMFAFDTCSGMEYLEMRRVVHRDLAARNVLVSDTGRAKVADFGLAREEGGPDAAAKLPIKWTAPEALKHNKFSNKSDMWSFGILLWEIYSFGRVPYPRIPLADVVKHVEKGYKMEAPEGCPPELYELMRQAWDLNPDTRPTFSQAKSKLAILKANTPVTVAPAI